jgi:hypothetical protein
MLLTGYTNAVKFFFLLCTERGNGLYLILLIHF